MAGVDGAIQVAQNAQRRGRHQEAVAALFRPFDGGTITAKDLERLLRALLSSLRPLGLRRAEVATHLFLGDVASAARVAGDHPIDLARCAVVRGNPAQAAGHFADAGWLGHAALQLELASDARGARVLWERLVNDARLATDLYTRGLVSFNLARCCRTLNDDPAARRARVRSVHDLEAAADGFETAGQRERAFDCYQVLLSMGSEGAFENLAEGYLNCIRILSEDNLKHYVLQYYEDFVEMALKAGELLAASTLFREAADFAARHRMPYSTHYRLRAAETLMLVAAQAMRSGGAGAGTRSGNAQIAENAYGAAIESFADLGQFGRVREVYGRMASLELPEKRLARYARLERRYAGVPDEVLRTMPFPDHLKVSMAYPDVWRADVIEWEQQGDPAETMAEVLLDPQRPVYTRERAITAQLRWLTSPSSPPADGVLAAVATDLGRAEIYAAIAPLERLFRESSAIVRRAVMKAFAGLYFKRSFVTVIAGLDDPDASVRGEALGAVATLRFGHALDPLRRIFHTARSTEARRAALESIGRIPSLDAADALIDTLVQGVGWEREVAVTLLRRREGADVRTLLEQAAVDQTGPAKDAIESLLRTS